MTHSDRDALLLDSTTSISLSNVRGLRYQEGTRRPTGTGVAIGAALGTMIGGAIGAAVAEPCRSCFLDFSQMQGALTGGLAGALLGGVVGAAVASGMEVDRWHDLKAPQLERLGVPRQGPAIGVAVGYDFPTGGSGYDLRRAGPGLIVRGSLAARGNAERYLELSVRRVSSDANVGSGAYGSHTTDGRTSTTVMGVSVGTRQWLGFLGTGRFLPYIGMSVGYQTADGDASAANGFRSSSTLGADVFTSSRSHLFVEARYLIEDERDRDSIGIFVGAKVRP